MTPVDLLRSARAIIVERGWSQGRFSNFDGSFCMVGALNSADREAREEANDPDGWRLVWSAARGILDSVTLNGTASLVIWNDAPGRTKADVLAAFDRAIALAESGAAS